MILISACLLGVSCRWDGAALAPAQLPEEFSGLALLPVCPEELGGLATPRPPAELGGGDGRAALSGSARVLRADGEDVTAAFLRGARAAAGLALAREIKVAVLKGGSPSCGVCRTRVAGRAAPGLGVAAAALARAGLRLIEID